MTKMNLFTYDIENKIKRNIIGNSVSGRYDLAAKHISITINFLHKSIPDNKRISYGIYYTIKSLGEHLYQKLEDSKASTFSSATAIFDHGSDDNTFSKSKGTALKILSLWAIDETSDFKKALPYFERAATSDFWDLREYAAGFFPKVIKKYPAYIQSYLEKLAESEDENVRRWVSETLRPARENKWFHRQPEYPLSILKKMFRESKPYPRTSVGNNLSDLARRSPDLIYSLVEELVSSGDKNSYWIAYRSCRNLVKKDPIKVMNLLRIDEYKYKKRIHKRSDYAHE